MGSSFRHVPDDPSADRSPPRPSARPPTLRLGGLWRHEDFLRLWSAQAISALGSQITLLALPLTALLVLHAKPYEVALLATAGSLPTLAVGIPAGVWVDRVRRRPVIIAADLVRAATIASLPAAYALGSLTLPHLYVVAVVNGAFSTLFEIASQAYLPYVVTRAQLIEANAKFEASRVVAGQRSLLVGHQVETVVPGGVVERDGLHAWLRLVPDKVVSWDFRKLPAERQ